MKLNLRIKRKRRPPNLFDESYYVTQNDDVRQSGIDPWRHFCEWGHLESRNPNPLFDVSFYRQKYLSKEEERANPLLHYLQNWQQMPTTHPLFDPEIYASQIDMDSFSVSPLEHFLNRNNEDLASPSLFFSTKRYFEQYPEVQPSGQNALYHFLRFGEPEGRSIRADFDLIELLKFRQMENHGWLIDHPQKDIRFLASLAKSDLTLPLIVAGALSDDTADAFLMKRMAVHVQQVYGCNVVNLFWNGSETTTTYEAAGTSVVIGLDDESIENSDHNKYEVNEILQILRRLRPIGAFSVSGESVELMDMLASLDVPVSTVCSRKSAISSKSRLEEFVAANHSIVLVSETSSLENKISLLQDVNQSVRSVCFSLESIGDDDEPVQSTSRSGIIQKLQLPPTAKMVVSVGNFDLLAGIDSFISTAITTLDTDSTADVCFVRIGQHNRKNRPMVEALYSDIERRDLASRVRLVHDPAVAADVLEAADIFLLTQRATPRPSLVSQLLKMGRPIVWFDNDDMVSQFMGSTDCVATAGNIHEATGQISRLLHDEQAAERIGRANYSRHQQVTCVDGVVQAIAEELEHAILSQRPDQETRTNEEPTTKLRLFQRTDKRRVVFTAPTWDISGVNTFIETAVDELRNLGFDAFILFTTNQVNKLGSEKLPAVPHRLLTNEEIPRARERRDWLKNYLSMISPCVFVPNYDYIASTVTPELSDNAVATLGVLHSDDPQHYVHGYRMGPYWDEIVSVSSTIDNKLREINPAFAPKCSVIPYGIKMPNRHISARSGDEETPRLKLIYTGRVVQHQKRIFDFVEIARKLNHTPSSFKMTFVGEGVDFDEFSQRMTPYVESGLVTILGRRTPHEVQNLLLAHDVIMLTSEFEGLPLSLLEGLAAGLVPVVTEIESGISEVLDHGVNALTSPIGDTDKFVANLFALLEDHQLFNRLSVEARKTVPRHELTSADMGRKYAEIINGLFDRMESAGRNESQLPIYCPNIERMLNVA